MATTKRRSLYPPWHRPSDDPYYLDDTLDAYPPYHLLRGKPTPEAMEAARAKAIERGYPLPKLPAEAEAAPEARPAERARARRPKRAPEAPETSAKASKT